LTILIYHDIIIYDIYATLFFYIFDFFSIRHTIFNVYVPIFSDLLQFKFFFYLK